MSAAKPAVVVIEDDLQIRRFLKPTFEQHGFRYVEAMTGAQGLIDVAAHLPDLVLLDLGLPDRDGLSVITEIRTWSQVPIIVLSARDQERDKVAALDAGADDYLTKPFGVEEMMARTRAALRRVAAAATPGGSAVFREGELEVDLARRLVSVAGKEIHLTPIEYRLLTTFIAHAGKVLTHKQLLRAVWGPHAELESQYLRVYMNQLRNKIEPEPARPRYLITETGVGYRLRVT